MFEAVFFDLDGTLADTAADLGNAVNRLRREEGLADMPLRQLRPYTSHGARGLLKAGFGIGVEHPSYQRLHHRFLEFYAETLCVETRLFEGMERLLDSLDAKRIPWGIVTNKRRRFTEPLVGALGLATRAAAVVSGDTTSETKPSPLPVLHACRTAGCSPERALFVGDDLRGIQAGNSAGTTTVAVAYGYLGDGEPIENWNADFLARDVAQLHRYIFGH